MGSINPSDVQRFDRSNTDGIINTLFRDGCCIITKLTDADTISQVHEEVRQYLDADKPWEVSIRQPLKSRVASF